MKRKNSFEKKRNIIPLYWNFGGTVLYRICLVRIRIYERQWELCGRGIYYSGGECVYKETNPKFGYAVRCSF